jgi:hypothetical protein
MFKLAEKLRTKYNLQTLSVELPGFDDAGEKIVYPFHTGDLVREKKSGRIAKYLTQAYWQSKGLAIVQFLDKPISVKDHHHGKKFNFDYMKDSDLELVVE